LDLAGWVGPWRQRRFERTRKGGRLYPVALRVSGVPRPCGRVVRRSRSGSPPFVDPETVEDRGRGSRLAHVTIRRSPDHAGSESRAGSLEAGVSPDFRAAVSLGPLTFSRNPV